MNASESFQTPPCSPELLLLLVEGEHPDVGFLIPNRGIDVLVVGRDCREMDCMAGFVKNFCSFRVGIHQIELCVVLTKEEKPPVVAKPYWISTDFRYAMKLLGVERVVNNPRPGAVFIMPVAR